MENNEKIRQDLRLFGIRQWELAIVCKTAEGTICRWLRTPLSEKHEKRIRAGIDEILEMRSKALAGGVKNE